MGDKPTHRAVVLAYIEVEFTDDGDTDLLDQAHDAAMLWTGDLRDADVEVLDVIDLSPPPPTKEQP